LFQPLLYQVAIEPPANEIGDIGLEIRERRDEVGPQGEDLVGIRLGKGAHPWLLAAGPWRPDDIARDADDDCQTRFSQL
jgi:hypothetical protein